ncbi:hypothetical protein ACOMHN_056813 [Nucella lapillus]
MGNQCAKEDTVVTTNGSVNGVAHPDYDGEDYDVKDRRGSCHSVSEDSVRLHNLLNLKAASENATGVNDLHDGAATEFSEEQDKIDYDGEDYDAKDRRGSCHSVSEDSVGLHNLLNLKAASENATGVNDLHDGAATEFSEEPDKIEPDALLSKLKLPVLPDPLLLDSRVCLVLAGFGGPVFDSMSPHCIKRLLKKITERVNPTMTPSSRFLTLNVRH